MVLAVTAAAARPADAEVRDGAAPATGEGAAASGHTELIYLLVSGTEFGSEFLLLLPSAPLS
jgi:hypothetical protein